MGTKVRGRVGDFLRLRKQSDTVKMICLFALAALVFMVCVAYYIWQICRYVNTPAEYIVTGEGAVSNQRIAEIMQDRDVSEVSRQMMISVSVQYKGAETVLDCAMLSQEYMAELTGEEIHGGSSRIYMNEAAFAEFQEALSEKGMDSELGEGTGTERAGSEIDIRYSMGEEAVDDSEMDHDGKGSGAEMGGHMRRAVQNYHSAKLVILKTGGEEAESFIYTAETESQLAGEATDLRVRFGRHDLDGLHAANLRKLGYELESKEVVMEEEHGIQMNLLHIRYGLVICGICILGALVLWRKRF